MSEVLYIDELIERCQAVISGQVSDESEWKKLRDEIVGAFNQGEYAHIGFEASYLHWSEVYGGLRLYRDDKAREVEKARAQSPNVSASASAISEVSLDIAVSQAVNAVMKVEGLTSEDKAHAAGLLNDAEAEKDAEKKAGKVLEALKWAIEKGGPSIAAMALHQLRHSNLSMMARRMSPFDLKDWAGWSSIAPAKIYVHRDMDAMRAAVNDVWGMLGAPNLHH